MTLKTSAASAAATTVAPENIPATDAADRDVTATARPGAPGRCNVLVPAWLAAGPLTALVEGRGGFSACMPAPVDGDGHNRADPLVQRDIDKLERAYYRGMERGWYGLYTADELAVRLLMLHPANVWGHAWIDACLDAAAFDPSGDADDPEVPGELAG